MIRVPALLSAAAALLLAGCSATGGQRVAIDNRAIGTDTTGAPCTLQFRWNDKAASTGVARSYSVNCGGSAGRAAGLIRVTLEPPADLPPCGPAQPVVIPGIGAAEARRCAAPELGGVGVAIAFRRGGLHYLGVAQPTVAGPLQTALIAVAKSGGAEDAGGGDAPDRDSKPVPLAFDVNALPAFTGAAPAELTTITNPEGLLRTGIQQNRLGLYLDASRALNGAISRLDPDASPTLRAELELEAALADSNIGSFGVAQGHFDAAVRLLDAPDGRRSDRALLLAKKLRVYQALDQLNQRRPDRAVAMLATLARADARDAAAPADASRGLLFDPAVQRQLNVVRSQSAEASRALANDAGERDLQTLDILADRTRSIALLGLNQVADASAALDAAQATQRQLVESAARGNLAWLNASIERQRARIYARSAPARWADARDAAERAIASLRQASRESGYVLGQAIAEARIEHARYMQEAGADETAVVAEYEGAVDSLAESSAPGVTNLPGIERYLDLLVAQAKNKVADAPARFFRVVQVLGKPAIARQTADIQSIVNEDPAVADKVRQRLAGLAEVRRLTNVITDVEGGAAPPPGSTLAELRAERDRVEQSNDRLTAELQGSNKFRAVDDSPMALAELRDTVLQPGEVYFKLTALPLGATYGIAIGKSGATIYKSTLATAQLTALARRIRTSIDFDAPYEVGAAYGLFTLVAGDAADMLTADTTRRIVVDPAGPLEIVPLAVLVTDRQSSLWYAQHRKVDQNDFSQVAFMAATKQISTALGPRSFAITRSFKPIGTGRAFLGLGHHAPPAPAQEAAEIATLQQRSVCADKLSAYRQIWALPPISANELTQAAVALGDPQSRPLTGEAFSDAAVLADPELGQARVIHFATHGLPEQSVGCADIPPSLVTSLGGTGSDGLLSFDEVARLRLNANLVVLSACDTASGLSERASRQAGLEGGALTGLVRSFLAAEARAVLATYWKIPATEQSEQLLAAFYASGRTHDIGTALRDAQLSLIRSTRYSHPYNWGAFFLVGDGSKTMLGNAAVAEDAPPRQIAAR